MEKQKYPDYETQLNPHKARLESEPKIEMKDLKQACKDNCPSCEY